MPEEVQLVWMRAGLAHEFAGITAVVDLPECPLECGNCASARKELPRSGHFAQFLGSVALRGGVG